MAAIDAAAGIVMIHAQIMFLVLKQA